MHQAMPDWVTQDADGDGIVDESEQKKYSNPNAKDIEMLEHMENW